MDRLVTIIGGTGFVGTALVEVLARQGWRVRVLVRNPARAMRLKPLGDLGQIAAVQGDIRIPATLVQAMDGADAAINLVGILAEKSGQRFADVQAKGAGSAAAAAAAAGVRAFVQVSAIGADPASPSLYGRTKAEGEAAVLRAFADAVIVRPSLIFGAEDGFTNRFAKLIALSPVIPVIAPATRFQPVSVGDVADAIATILASPPDARTFELGGPEILTMRAIMAYIARETGQDKPLVDTPDAAARLLASLSFLPGAPLTRDQHLMLQRDNVADPALPGFDALGITPTPMASLAPEWLARYRPGGRFAAQ
jgi:uncharacterized protein YbjT (DUF2867 family)